MAHDGRVAARTPAVQAGGPHGEGPGVPRQPRVARQRQAVQRRLQRGPWSRHQVLQVGSGQRGVSQVFFIGSGSISQKITQDPT